MSTIEGQEVMRKQFLVPAKRSLEEPLELDEQHEDFLVFLGKIGAIVHVELVGLGNNIHDR